jgi:hypothetical protein
MKALLPLALATALVHAGELAKNFASPARRAAANRQPV